MTASSGRTAAGTPWTSVDERERGTSGARGDGGPTVLFANSLGTAQDSWWPQVEALAGEARCLTWDYWGHGEGGDPPPRPTLEAVTDEAVAVLDAAGADRVHVCGLSLGGMVAVDLAARYPERVASATVLSAPAYQENPQFWTDRAAAVRDGGIDVVSGGVAGRWFTSTFLEAHPEAAERVVAPLRAMRPSGYAACCEAIAGADVRDRARQVTCPATVVAGAQDVAVPASHGEILAAAIPGATLTVVDDGAHILNVSHPDLVTSLLRDRLAAA
ncbi:alpha/beta fold hydrolase [Georgenia alba]|uniref:Alpha/beta fold hydrolase n=1 Tax=Georgenia alba TaxID=2233858 RepID=A0ABW2Q801_9MICO